MSLNTLFRFILSLSARTAIQFICTGTVSEHTERMDSNRIPNNLLNYRPHGRRSLGRPLKRWNETVTGHLP
jgi:hypothetical protein